MIRLRTLLLTASILLMAAPLSAAELVHAPAGGTYSDSTRSRGFWFTAPVAFTINALRVPNVGSGPQNLQVMTLPSSPPNWSSTTTNYTTLFYTNSGSSGANDWVAVNVTIPAGSIVGILGTRGSSTMHNAYSNTSTWNTTIDGNGITLRRFGTQVNINGQQAGPVWTESGGSYSRVEMDYSTGPSAVAGGPYAGGEGTVITLDGSASTSATGYAWDCTADGSNECTTITCGCTYPDDGTYSALLTVSSSQGTDTDTATVNVANLPPSSVTIGGPTSGNEGDALAFTGSAVDVATDPITWQWNFDDGTTSTSQNPTHTFTDDGSYTVTLTATDDDGGSTTTSATVTIANVAPTLTSATGNGPQDEGTAVAFTTSITDPGAADTHTYSWAFGDGTNGTGASPSHVYADDGTYSAVVTVTDDDGGTDTATVSVTVNNVAPNIAAQSGPTAGDEGSPLTYVAVGTDPGSVDAAALTYTWDWGDGTAVSSGAGATHSWADDGTYTVTVTTADPQGATGTATLTVTIANVAPIITSTPPLFATEGTVYTYTPTSSDPGADPPQWALSPSSPVGMALTAGDDVEWTPTFADVGTHPVTLTVDDGDGSTDQQTWTISVGFIDTDGDGLADSWETANGLDPTGDDSTGDPDGDGRDNITEFLGGTDPNVWDGPSAPILTAPIGGEEVAQARPELNWDDATSPPGDPLTYEVEVYEDAALSILVTSTAGLLPDGSGSSSWQLDIPLNENGTYYWQARADDGYTTGAWAAAEAFFVNETNEPPDVPILVYPVGGEAAAATSPELQWSVGMDIDQDDVGFRVRVWDEAGENILTSGELDPSLAATDWTVDITLDEDTVYLWEAQAFDEHGLDSTWSAPEAFVVDTTNAAPGDAIWISPADGQVLAITDPELLATETTDPEGDVPTYVFALDTVATFDGADYVEYTSEGAANVDLAAEGASLRENTLWYGRVRAVDTGGVGGTWDEISFFVAGPNDAPPVPVLVAPEDDSRLDTAVPTFVVQHVEDPDGDVVFYEIAVASDVELLVSVASTSGLVGGAGPEGGEDQTSWTSDMNLSGTVFWTARAVDSEGEASEWAEPWTLTIGGDAIRDPNAGEPDATAGCESCESSFVSTDSTGGLLLLPLLLLLRRRRA